MARELGTLIGKRIAAEREKKRQKRLEEFRQKPDLWRVFVGKQLQKHQVLKRVEQFVNGDHKKPRRMLKRGREVLLDIKPALVELDEYNAYLEVNWLIGSRIFKVGFKDKKIRKNFEKGKFDVTDDYGNPRMLGIVCLSFQSLLQCCYMGLTATHTVDQLKGTEYWNAHKAITNAREGGEIKQLDSLQVMNPALKIVKQAFDEVAQMKTK